MDIKPQARREASPREAVGGPPTLSVVIPCFNELDGLDPLLARLKATIQPLVEGRFEVIFVDDASTDGSGDALDACHRLDPRIKVLHLSRNFGHQAALSAGLEVASGAAVVLMDCDLQDPPEVISEMVAKWRTGWEVVFGVRRHRKEGVFKRLAYFVFYRSLRAISRIDLPLDAGDFCLLDAKVVEALVGLPEQHRFLRGLRSWVGFRQIGVEFERDARFAGEPKYTLAKLIRLAVSGYLGFSIFPLRLAAWLGFAAAGAGFLTAAWALATRFLDIAAPRGWASTIAVVLFLGGIQLLVLSVVGEYLGRVYDEARGRPAFIVRESLGVASRVGRRAGSDAAAGG